MARATRSTTAQEKEKVVETAPPARKAASKKRKRTSIAEQPDQPAAKVVRTEDSVKEEDAADVQELQQEETAEAELPSSGDVPIQPEDAEKILEVLETVDTQGLLDRIFPLPTEHSSDSAAGPSTGTQSYSFRALLKSPSNFPLRVLRTAVHHLFPISSHPRSRPSAPAAEQLRFCNLALSLLDQASFHSAPVPPDVERIFSSHLPQEESQPDESKPATSQTEATLGKRKYALVQRLPTGDWWSSTTSSYPSLALDGKDIKTLGTGYAELVSIFPSAQVPPSADQPTLGSYIPKRPPVSNVAQEARRLTCGRFLDYGPYTSFAPTFDQEGVEVGQATLSEVVYYRTLDRRRRERMFTRRKQPVTQDVVMEDSSGAVEASNAGPSSQETQNNPDVDASLEGLLSPEQVAAVKQALGSLELENAVDELLARNARALAKLEELQRERLLSSNREVKPVEEGSDEWEIAQGILNSLTVLASLRPRSSSDSESTPLVPTTAALRKLHRTLPIGATGGWYGTLPENRATALRDDTTVHIRSGAAAAAAAPAPVPPTPATPAPAAPKASATPYNHYAYPAYAPATSYRGGYGTYATGQTNYYPNYPPATPVSAGTHYPAQQYGTSGAQSYPYSSWYNYQPTAPSSTAPSGQATPQATPTTAATPSGYQGFFANTQQPQPQRAVANTVLAGKPYPAGGWAPGAAAAAASPYVAPLPAHLRAAAPGSAPGTPQPASTTTPYSGYYATYQPPQPAAR